MSQLTNPIATGPSGSGALPRDWFSMELKSLFNELLKAAMRTANSITGDDRTNYGYIGFDARKIAASVLDLKEDQRKTMVLWLLMRGPKVDSKSKATDKAYIAAQQVTNVLLRHNVTFAQAGNLMGAAFAYMLQLFEDVPIRAPPPSSEKWPRTILWSLVQYLSVWKDCWDFQELRAIQMSKVFAQSPAVKDQSLKDLRGYLALSRTPQAVDALSQLVPGQLVMYKPDNESQTLIKTYLASLKEDSIIRDLPDFPSWADLEFVPYEEDVSMADVVT